MVDPGCGGKNGRLEPPLQQSVTLARNSGLAAAWDPNEALGVLSWERLSWEHMWPERLKPASHLEDSEHRDA